MKVQVNAQKTIGAYQDPTRWMNSTLRYVPPVDFPAYLESRLGKPEIMRVWITLDEFWDYRTDTTYPDYEIGKARYPVSELHYPYDWASIVPAPSGTRFVDYLTSHARHSETLLLNVRRYEREVSDGVITFEQYEDVFTRAVEYCKELAPNIRYIECCNEVDIVPFGKLNAKEYVNIYLRAHRIVQMLNEKHQYEIPLEIGGYAAAHPLMCWDMMRDVMTMLKESEIGEDPMAFYSYHIYNDPISGGLAVRDMLDLSRASAITKIQKIAQQHHDLIEELQLPKKPVFLNEVGRARATGVDWDCIHNAAGLITYLVAFCKGDLGGMLPFPWCTFHNPNLQLSYTQFLLNPDGTYKATPNGIAVQMFHEMQGNMLEATVSETWGQDIPYRAIAVENEEGISVLSVNTTSEGGPVEVVVEGLADGKYHVDVYRCSRLSNNSVTGKSDGVLRVNEQLERTAESGKIRYVDCLDKDSFVLLKISKM